MTNFKRVALTAVLLGSVAMPVLAESPAAGDATTAPATHDVRPGATMPKPALPTESLPNPGMKPAGMPAGQMDRAPSTPSERNSALTDSGEVRVSKIVGSSVYNGRNEKVGTVDDIVLGRDNKADRVIISVGGFLGMGKHYVAVPYSDLKLGDTRNASSHNKVVLPMATKDALKSMSEYRYTR